MKKLFAFSFAVLFYMQVIAQAFLHPVSVTVGNELIGTTGLRAVGGTAYGGGEFNENRNIIRFVETIAPGESVSFDVGNSNNMYLIGLATGTSQTNVYSSPVGNAAIKYGMMVGNGNVAQAYEGGYQIGPAAPIQTGSVLQISYTASKIQYKISTNSGVNYTLFYQSLVNPSGTYSIYFEAPPQYAGPLNIFKSGTVVNQPPVVNAGADQTVSLPITSTTLTGSITDADGVVNQRSWEKVSGPPGGAITTSEAISTQITGLQAGNYVYKLTGTDNHGASATDQVGVSVIEADPNGSTVISLPVIPFSAPEIQHRGGGSEQWFDQYYVPIPEDDQKLTLDAVYWRFAWKEIETSQNVFRWKTLDDQFKWAIDHKAVFGFGIMTQTASANWFTGVQMDQAEGIQMFYPLYLHNQMQAEATNSRDFKRHDNGEWVPNYNSPNFLRESRKLLDSIYAWIMRSSYNGVPYKNVVNYIDIRHVGEWGEWHFNMTAPDTTYWPAGRQPTIASYQTIIDHYAAAFPTFKEVINFSVYDARQIPNTWIPPDVAYYALKKKNGWGFIGWRRDQWGFADNQATYVHNWTDQNIKTFGGIRFDTVIMDRHNFAPVIGEPPGNWNNFDDPYMKNLPHEARLYGAQSFGNGNFWTSPMYEPDLMSEGSKDSVRMASKVAGPRLQIDSAVMSSSAMAGGSLTVKLYWKNTGICPVYDVFFAKFLIKNVAGEVAVTDTSSFRAKYFRVSQTAQPFVDGINLPVDLPPGTYSLDLIIEDSLGYRPPLAIANEGRNPDGSYTLRPGFPVTTGGPNKPPVVIISGKHWVELPKDLDTLYAGANDPDGTVASYQWSKVRGPAGGTITSPTAKNTTLTGLTRGIYIYKVVVTDNGGLKGQDAFVLVVGNPPNPIPPTPKPKHRVIVKE